MSNYCAIDLESTPIDPITKRVEKIWLIGWYFKDVNTGELTYDCLKFIQGMTPEAIANHVENAATLAVLATSEQKLYYDKLRTIRDILAGNTFYKPVFHNASFDVTHLEYCGFAVPSFEDTMVAAFVLLPPATLGSMGEEDAMRLYSLSALGKIGLCSQKLDSPLFTEWSDAMEPYNKGDCKATYELAEVVLPAVTQDTKASRAYALDKRMIPILSGMQQYGTMVDKAAVDVLAEKVTTRAMEVDTAIRAQAAGVLGPVVLSTNHRGDTVKPKPGLYPAGDVGSWVYEGLNEAKGKYAYRKVVPFNPSSAPHRVIALKELCGWVPSKFSKKTNDPVCDKTILAELADDYHFAHQLAELGKLQKLVSTYLPAFSKTDYQGRIHPGFLLTATRTSRLSSREPNFQNIPKQDMRELIVARPGCKIVVVDLSQIELRILAWLAAQLANNFYLWGLYSQGADVHSSNMRLLETDNRRLAKNGIFLKIYGGGAGKLAATLGIPLVEAQDKLRLMDERMPFINEVADVVISQAFKAKGNTIYTLYGHKLAYPYITSNDRKLSSKAKRQYFNGIIQGSQSDIIKIIMTVLYYEERYNICENYGARFLLQVHDEVVWEVAESNVPIVMNMVDEVCTNKTMLPGLPIIGISGSGDNWKTASENSEVRAAEYVKKTYGV